MRRIAVCLAHWKRPENIGCVIRSIVSQSIDAQVLVWNNSGVPFRDSRVDWVVDSSRNAQTWPRWLMASQADSEFVCTLDDDLAFADSDVLSDAVHCLEQRDEDVIVGAFGLILGKDGSYSRGIHCGHAPITDDMSVDVVKGRFLLVRRTALESIPLLVRNDFIQADIALSGTLARGRRRHHVLPRSLNGRFQELAEGDVGASMRPQHMQNRDHYVRRFFAQSASDLAIGTNHSLLSSHNEGQVVLGCEATEGIETVEKGMSRKLDSTPQCELPAVPDLLSNQAKTIDDQIMELIPKSARRIVDLTQRGSLADLLQPRQGSEIVAASDAFELGESKNPVNCVGPSMTADGSPRSALTPLDCVIMGPGFLADVDGAETLRAIKTSLVDDGSVIAILPNAMHHRTISGLLSGTWSPLESVLHGNPPARVFTRREIEKLFYRGGFEIESCGPLQNSELDQWIDQGSPGRIDTEHLQIDRLSESEAEGFYAVDFIVRGRPADRPCYPCTSIVIVTHNELSYTRQCVNSILQFTDPAYELIFVDNGSTDGTIEYLRSLEGITLIENCDNRGFPAAVNQGIDVAGGKQILLLNNDTIVTTGWLDRLLAALHEDSRIGLAGPCSNHVSGSQQVPVTYTDLTCLDGFAWEWGKTHNRTLEDCDRLVGFCLIFRREVIDKIGLFDERFGIGNFEDDDFTLRARQAGYRTVIARDAFVHHFGSRTFRGAQIDQAALLRENERKFRKKWSSTPQQTQSPSTPPGTQLEPGTLSARLSPLLAIQLADGGGLQLVRKSITVSLCMIVRDNEDTIGAALSSIEPWVDEIVVVDTGSIDQTPTLAQQHGARLFHFPWCDSFAAARNESIRHATGEWIFWMDSDDTISPQCGQQLRTLVDGQHDPDVLGYVMQVHCPAIDGTSEHDVTAVDHIKLFRNRPELRFEYRIHEQILPAIRRAGGDVGWTDIFVVHSGADHSPEGQRRKHQRDLHLLELELADHPNHPFALFNLGMTLADAREFQQAAEALSRSIAASEPDESHLRKAYALLVSCHRELGHLHQAIEVCQEGRRHFPHDAELAFRLGMIQHDLGNPGAAINAYKEALDTQEVRHFSSVDQGISGFKARHNLAVVYSDTGDLASAEQQWRLALADASTHRESWRGLADVLRRQGKSKECQRVANDLKNNPQLLAEGMVIEAHLASDQGRVEESLEILRGALDDPHAGLEALQHYCRLQFDHGTLQAAEQALLRLARVTPDDASVLTNLGSVYFRASRYEQATAAFERSLELRPDCNSTRALLHQARDERNQHLQNQRSQQPEMNSLAVSSGLRTDPT